MSPLEFENQKLQTLRHRNSSLHDGHHIDKNLLAKRGLVHYCPRFLVKEEDALPSPEVDSNGDQPLSELRVKLPHVPAAKDA